MEEKMTVDLRDYDTSRETLARLLRFQPGMDGKEMSEEQKKAALVQFMNFVIMI